MFTELLRKQLSKELEFIYSNLYSLIQEFHPRFIDDFDSLSFFFGFTNDFIYMQIHWMDEQGGLMIDEADIDYNDYAEFCKKIDKGV